MKSRVRVSSQVEAYLAARAPEVRRELRPAIKGLAAWNGRANPPRVRFLEDELEGYLRLRVAQHRIIFREASKDGERQILCLYAAPRSTVYETFAHCYWTNWQRSKADRVARGLGAVQSVASVKLEGVGFGLTRTTLARRGHSNAFDSDERRRCRRRTQRIPGSQQRPKQGEEASAAKREVGRTRVASSINGRAKTRRESAVPAPVRLGLFSANGLRARRLSKLCRMPPRPRLTWLPEIATLATGRGYIVAGYVSSFVEIENPPCARHRRER